MANMAVLVRRQSSRELRPQKSYDRIELRELHGRLLSSDGNAGQSVNYGALNAAFKDEDPEKGDDDDDGKRDGKPKSVKKVTVSTTEPEAAVFTDEGEERDSWDSKLTFLLATIGYAVGLGNVWRFPYLAQKNGGGAFLIPYFIMLAIEGMPIFFLELALGQRLRKGAIGVWNQVSPYLAGIGISSAVVSFNVALYYNTIISWCLLYFVKSFQNPLPWESCPTFNGTMEPECEKSGPTQYFWYRKTLDISTDIEHPQNFNLQIAAALFVAWTLVYCCLAKGIASSTKVVYITAIFPYVVLVLFFCRGVTLKGMGDGILHLFTPKWEMLGEPRVWLEAGTQIFFSLGLGFGGLIAFASYNPVNNNCCRDAITVSLTNCFTSMFAGLVIFSVIGFKAHWMHDQCLEKVNKTILDTTGIVWTPPYPEPLSNISIPHTNPVQYRIVPNYTVCNLQEELDKTASGPGLAFIIFTDAINQFSFSPFWSILFFSMLFTLGIDSQFGTLEGVVTSIVDMKLFPNLRKEILTGVLCGICCALSMMFAHGAGNYIFFLFDSFAGNMPLLVIAFFECIGVSYIYGLSRFAEDIHLMTGKRPHIYWMLCWKYISPVAIIVILAASWYNIIIDGSKYPRWDPEKAENFNEKWPNWALCLAVFLVLIAVIWIPVVAIMRRMGHVLFSKEEPSWFPADDLRDFHGIVAHDPTSLERALFGFHEDGSEGICFRTTPKKDDEDDDDDDPLT